MMLGPAKAPPYPCCPDFGAAAWQTGEPNAPDLPARPYLPETSAPFPAIKNLAFRLLLQILAGLVAFLAGRFFTLPADELLVFTPVSYAHGLLSVVLLLGPGRAAAGCTGRFGGCCLPASRPCSRLRFSRS